MPRFSVTYEIVTPESAEHGDAEERGYIMPGEWRYDINDPSLEHEKQDYTMTLREALTLASPDCDCGAWFAESGESRVNYRTGAVEQRSIHPPRNITRSSYNRLARLLGVSV